VQESTPAEVDV